MQLNTIYGGASAFVVAMAIGLALTFSMGVDVFAGGDDDKETLFVPDTGSMGLTYAMSAGTGGVTGFTTGTTYLKYGEDGGPKPLVASYSIEHASIDYQADPDGTGISRVEFRVDGSCKGCGGGSDPDDKAGLTETDDTTGAGDSKVGEAKAPFDPDQTAGERHAAVEALIAAAISDAGLGAEEEAAMIDATLDLMDDVGVEHGFEFSEHASSGKHRKALKAAKKHALSAARMGMGPGIQYSVDGP